MSAIALLFGWTGLPRLAQEAVAALAVAGIMALGYAYWHHHIYTAGIAAQQHADAVASAKAIGEARAQTIAAQNAANAAEEAYRDEITRVQADSAQHPIGPVRLCIDAHIGRAGVPEAGPAITGNAAAGAPAGSVPGVPAGDPGVRPGAGNDISGLLGAWAQKADSLSATIREFQSRQVHP